MVRHFVLVHGACHGAWCWYKVSAELKRAGHEVTTLDLAACGINPKRFEDVHSLVEYSEPLLTFLGSLGDKDKVVLVAHSMSGFSLCIAMERFPGKISVAVFVGATMLGPDLPYDVVAEEMNMSQDLELGITLVRPCPIWEPKQAAKDTAVTKEKYGVVPRAFVVCDQEEDGTFQWWQIENNPPDDHIVIEGSDHMVMFSKPGPLSSYLIKLGDKFV
ncbi:Methyl jasmonate esterase 1 [Linum perenne]